MRDYVTKITYRPGSGDFLIEGEGWARIASEQLVRRALNDDSIFAMRIQRDGQLVPAAAEAVAA